MQKITFQNLPNTTTPINATNLNAIQTNAETAINDVAGDLSDYVNGTTTMGNITTTGSTINGTQKINTPNNISSGLTVHAGTGNEGSIKYTNNDETKEYVAGYGTGGFDGFGIYSAETNHNIFEVDKNGIVTALNQANFGTYDDTQITGFDDPILTRKSFLGSIQVSGTWYILINIRHRNGVDDGTNYGIQIMTPMTYPDIVQIRNQIGGTWGSWRQI